MGGKESLQTSKITRSVAIGPTFLAKNIMDHHCGNNCQEKNVLFELANLLLYIIIHY